MKRYVRASIGPTEKLHKLIDYLMHEGVDEHTILEFFLDTMDSEKCIEMMKTLAEECDVDLAEFWEDLT